VATGRHVLLLNTDTLVHGDVLPEAVAWLDAHPAVGVLGPRVLNADGTCAALVQRVPLAAALAMQTLGLTRSPRLDAIA
jgi:GT2 family glycosyltransferase